MNATTQSSLSLEEAEVPQPHIVFAGGGTAGHLFPGLAVAEQLRRAASHCRITFSGTGKEFERKHVTRAGFEYLALPCHPLPKSPSQWWRFLADNFAGARSAAHFLKEQQVCAVVGLGSYASVPMGRAAARHGIPLVLLEQNAFPGRATRYLANKAEMICLALAKAKLHLRTRGRVFVTGNPIRAEFVRSMELQPVPPGTRHGLETHATLRLVVLGGSGGSSQLNRTVPKALHKVRSLLDGWQIVHQTGAGDRIETETLYQKLGLPVTVVPFVVNMSQVLRCTDLVISRAGGTTLAELAACGVPAVLVPWSQSAGDHQRRNAEVYTKFGAAVTLDVAAAIGRLDDALAELLMLPLTQVEVRTAMAAAMRRLARPDATEKVAARIMELLATHAQPAAA